MVDALDLGDHQAVEPIARPFDDGDDVVEAPPGVAGVHAHSPHLARELIGPERLHDLVARRYLRSRRDRVFEVEEDLISGRLVGLGMEPGIAAGYREAGATWLHRFD